MTIVGMFLASQDDSSSVSRFFFLTSFTLVAIVAQCIYHKKHLFANITHNEAIIIKTYGPAEQNAIKIVLAFNLFSN